MLPYRIAEPNEALIVTGARAAKDGATAYKIVVGHGVWVMPFFRKARALGLQAHQTVIQEDVFTTDGIPLGVKAVVVFKVGSNPDSIANAAQRFLENEQDMDEKARNVFAGHLRSIVGAMTPEEILRERTKLAEQVRSASAEEMQLLGLTIDSFQIQDLIDSSGYYQQLALPKQAAVRAEARIREAERNQEATEKEQQVAAAVAEATANSQVLQAQRTAEANEAQAKADQAGPRASAEAKMAVVEQETKVAELEAAQAQQRLIIEQVRPAEAERDAMKARAEGEKQKQVLEAEGRAEAMTVEADAQATKERKIGEARGDARKAELLAEAEGLKKRSEALAENQDAVIGQQVAESIPEIVAALAPMFQGIDNLTVYDGLDGLTGRARDAVSFGLGLLPVIQAALNRNGGSTPSPRSSQQRERERVVPRSDEA